MDPAVALVQAYLHLSGYLTVTEFPIVGAGSSGSEMVTDVDVIALRFPLAQPLGAGPEHEARPDPGLRVGDDAMDLLICEVKEGKARVNPNLKRADTLRATLERLGCCARAMSAITSRHCSSAAPPRWSTLEGFAVARAWPCLPAAPVTSTVRRSSSVSRTRLARFAASWNGTGRRCTGCG